MEYWITKECGNGWNDNATTACLAWGVSERQRRLAEKIAVNDVLLHYIDSAQAWAGYSRVTATLRENDRDKNTDWRNALPYVIPIGPKTWLDCGQSELTDSIPSLPNKHYYRQVSFTRIPNGEAAFIVDAIDKAYAVSREASKEFGQKWERDADAYYRQILMDRAGGKCLLCGDDAAARVATLNLQLSTEELATLQCAFLDAAHLTPKSQRGKLTPDNTWALCPSCHRIFDRLSETRRDELLKRHQPQSSPVE